ncbi:MAG: TlpA disulfide reductase family protein [Myxococcota bacterium]|nr:TlpA disulfide reductase family protein [Myxococcota bacterium]
MVSPLSIVRRRELVRVLLRSLVLCHTVLVFGCLETPNNRPQSHCEADGGSCDELSDRSRYPGFGTGPGAVIAPLSFVDGDGSEMNLGQIYADPTRKVLLLTTSAGWCTACIEEQPKLQQLHGEYHEQGLSVLVVLFEKQDYTPADARLARAWKARYELDFDVVADPEFIMRPFYPNGDSSSTPIILVIDVDTMTILDTMVGFQESAVRALITNNL